MNPDRARQDGKTHRGDELTVATAGPGPDPEPITKHAGRFLLSSRYRHPGDVIRLIVGGVVLVGTLAAVEVAPIPLLGPGASAVAWPGSDPASRLVQVAVGVAAAGVAATGLRCRRFRLLAGLAAVQWWPARRWWAS